MPSYVLGPITSGAGTVPAYWCTSVSTAAATAAVGEADNTRLRHDQGHPQPLDPVTIATSSVPCESQLRRQPATSLRGTDRQSDCTTARKS